MARQTTIEDVARAAVKLHEIRRDAGGPLGTGFDRRYAIQELENVIDLLPREVRKTLWRRGRSVHRV